MRTNSSTIASSDVHWLLRPLALRVVALVSILALLLDCSSMQDTGKLCCWCSAADDPTDALGWSQSQQCAGNYAPGRPACVHASLPHHV